MNYADMFGESMAPLLAQWFDQPVTIVTDGGAHVVAGMSLLQENKERRSDVYAEDVADLVMRVRKTTVPTLSVDALRRSQLSTGGVDYTVIGVDDDGVYWRLRLKTQATTDIRARGRREY